MSSCSGTSEANEKDSGREGAWASRRVRHLAEVLRDIRPVRTPPYTITACQEESGQAGNTSGGLRKHPRAWRHRWLPDLDLLVAKAGHQAYLTSDSADVGSQRCQLRSGDVAAFDAADAGLGDAHGAGDVLLGEAVGFADLGETVGDELAFQAVTMGGDSALVNAAVLHCLAADVAPALRHQVVPRSELRAEPLVVAVVGDRDVAVIPALPVASLVAGDEQYCPASWVAGEQDPDL